MRALAVTTVLFFFAVVILAQEWRQIQPASTVPRARFDASCAINMLDDELILFGGNTMGFILSSQTHLYSVEQNLWKNISSCTAMDTPKARKDAQLYHVGENNYILKGGYNGKNTVLCDTWQGTLNKDSACMQWKLISNGTDCIAAAAGTQAESILYQFGGQLGDSSYSNKLLLSTNAGQTWHELVSASSESPSARIWSSIAHDKVHHLLYIFGGLGLNKEILNDLWVYNMTSLQFTRLVASNCSRIESQPSCRSGHGSIVMDGVLYILGGEATNGDGLNDVWQYKYAWARESGDATWKKRLGACVFEWRNKMFLFAGIDGWKNMQMYNDMWVRE